MSTVIYRKMPMPSRSTAGNATIGADDYQIVVTDTSAARTITLAAGLAAVAGNTFEIIDAGGAAGLNNIILDTAGAEKINLSGTLSDTIFCVTQSYGRCRVTSDGTNWVVAEL